MTFLIDGYNLLHALGLARPRGPGQLEKARGDLMNWLHRVKTDQAASITVIFDGRDNLQQDHTVAIDHGIRVQFSVGQLADDFIEEMIQRERTPQRLTVVSSDHQIQEAARRRGCIVRSCSDFIDSAIDHGHSPPKLLSPPDKPDAPTPEETERWRKEFADLDADPELRKFNKPFEDFYQI